MFWKQISRAKQQAYGKLDEAANESGDPLLDTDPLFRSQKQSYLGQGLVFALLLLIAAFLGGLYERTLGIDRDDMCIRHVSQYSPILADVPLSFSVQRFDGSLLGDNPFRGPAGPETDAAWATLGPDYRAVVVPDSEAAASGLAPDQVRIRQKHGGGYPANVEGLHHLHCLNLMRKASHWSYDYYRKQGQGPFKNNETVLVKHFTHCLDILRQQLMCNVDIGVLGQVWIYPDAPEAFVDFNTNHKCRDFETVRAWAEVRQAPMDIPADYLAPPVEGGRIYEAIP